MPLALEPHDTHEDHHQSPDRERTQGAHQMGPGRAAERSVRGIMSRTLRGERPLGQQDGPHERVRWGRKPNGTVPGATGRPETRPIHSRTRQESPSVREERPPGFDPIHYFRPFFVPGLVFLGLALRLWHVRHGLPDFLDRKSGV